MHFCNFRTKGNNFCFMRSTRASVLPGILLNLLFNNLNIAKIMHCFFLRWILRIALSVDSLIITNFDAQFLSLPGPYYRVILTAGESWLNFWRVGLLAFSHHAFGSRSNSRIIHFFMFAQDFLTD